ncbi:hypothetical protein G6F70_000560 [Rhizopus microsporus]|nr:hypothetical protein G6F71_000092 [Rhizopus microsporus]KAG1204343.1 hypothetical protein G6F70_000560 [Rhizopus microsporus]KAG1215789.1 hypothetical protein G6F69_000688 [Rhizopus microsporus]KAG1238321.1 hypothetical protein G6F67_000514 [Rhizopus microsporus]KAG1268647.1 hypothetical protein G6F68_000953 [Rhizopus microsporus]
MTSYNREKLIKYFKSNLCMLPTDYTQTETNRLDWIDWVYAQQILPTENDDANDAVCGFRGSSWSGRSFDPHATTCSHVPYDSGHVANTYTALINLLLLGDDLSRVNRKAITNTLRHLQQQDGRRIIFSIAPTTGSLERDVRFIYCACAISYMLNDWSGIDRERTLDHIIQLQSYEHAFAQCPKQEAHGGSTFCGTAALSIMGNLDEGILNKDQLVQWCLFRQIGGFQGASLAMLDSFHLVNSDALKEFLLQSESRIGGFAKDPESFPDLLHSYMGVATLSLMNEPNVQPIHAALNMPLSAYKHLKENTVFWKQ